MTEQTDHATDDAPPAVRVEVVGGGAPSDEQLAALVVALTPAVAATTVDDVPGGPVDEIPAWARAALIEGIGGRRPTRPSDLRLPFDVD